MSVYYTSLISNWYEADVEVSKHAKERKETFSGIMSRKSYILQVLKIMEAGGVKFKIEGRKIIVM